MGSYPPPAASVADVSDRPGRLLGVESVTRVATAPTNTAIAVGVADQAILPANANALERTIVNDSPNLVYLALGGGAAALGAGIRLNPNGGTWSTQRYTGAVRGIAAAAGSNCTLSEVA